MKCKRCGADMQIANIFNLTDGGLNALVGFECVQCGMALLDSGEWIDMRADPDEDAADDDGARE